MRAGLADCKGGQPWACLDCNDDYKRCTRCGMSKFTFLAKNASCMWCTGLDGPCDPEYGCRPDGQCVKCGGYDEYTWIFDKKTQKLQCQLSPDGCEAAQTRTDGTCRKCMAGYVMAEAGKCKRCPNDCKTCGADLKCIECESGYKLLTVLGKCKRSDDLNVCKKCMVSFGGLKGDKCGCNWCGKPPGSDCSWASGEQHPLSCNTDRVCLACDYGYGRVGKQCEKCKVKFCLSCDGNSSKCAECDLIYVDKAGPSQLYPAEDGTKCSQCTEPKCLECRGLSGPCIKCAAGWGAVKGKCQRCNVKGCKSCNGDVNSCTDCGGNDCDNYKYHDFDPRTKTCVALDGVIDC
ncbi:hypothetical protein ABPG75_004012 [Micractinium tetrahymenae]